MTTAGGLDEPTRNAVAAAAPLLLAYLAGDPLRCIVTAHDGQAPEAVTILLGGAPWCGECRP